MPWVRAPAIAYEEDESHPLPDRATGLPILRPHTATGEGRIVLILQI
jgi:hypothetical protein